MSNTKYLEISIPKYYIHFCENVNSEEIFVFEFFFLFSRERVQIKMFFKKSVHLNTELPYIQYRTHNIIYKTKYIWEKPWFMYFWDQKDIWYFDVLKNHKSHLIYLHEFLSK